MNKLYTNGCEITTYLKDKYLQHYPFFTGIIRTPVENRTFLADYYKNGEHVGWEVEESSNFSSRNSK